MNSNLFYFRKEQAELKMEIEKMSDLIAELRENCQKLQTELLDSRNNLKCNVEQKSMKSKPRDTSSVGVQVTILTGK